MRTILIALSIISIISTQVVADVKLEASKFTVSVNLTDGATGACWTGTRQLRDYIEEELQEIGFKLGYFNKASALKNQYVFDVSVFSKRKTLGELSFCDGGVQTVFKTNTNVHGEEHVAQLAGYLMNGSNADWNDTARSLAALVIKEIENYFK